MMDALVQFLPPVPEKRYRIHVLDGRDGYLNVTDNDVLYLGNSINQPSGRKSIFTEDEVNKFKLRQDLNIDWDNALEEVEDED